MSPRRRCQPTSCRAELQALRDLCSREYPKWTESDGYVYGRRGTVSKEENDFEWLLQFGRAILAISNMHVLDKPNAKCVITAHVDDCAAVLRSLGKNNELRVGPLVMACFVMHVPVSGLGIDGCSISIGLSDFVGRTVDPGAWRATLAAGRLPAQFGVERRFTPSAPIHIEVIRPSVI